LEKTHISGKTRRDKLWNKNFTILFIANVASMIGFQMINPNMAAYASSLGAAESALGAVTAMFSTAALVARPFSGKTADRMDNRKMIFISLLAITISLFAYNFADSMPLLLAARFAHGVLFGLNSTIVMTMASRVLPEERLGSGIGVFGIGQILSFSVGPYIGIYIADNMGYDWLFTIAATFSLIAAVLALFLSSIKTAVPGEVKAKEPFWKTFFAPEAAGPCMIAFLTSTTYGAVNTFLVLHAKGRGVEDIGLFFVINAIVLVSCRPVLSRIIDRVSMKLILYPSIICLIGSMIFVGFANSLAMFLTGAVLLGIGNGGAQPVMQAMCLKSVGFERRGAASGTYYIGLDLGNTFGPIVTGIVSSRFGYGNAFLSMIIPLAMSLVVTFMTGKKQEESLAA